MLHTSKIERRLMGSDFELVAIDPDAEKAADYLEEGVAEIKRIEQLLTVFDPASQASLINRNAAVAPVTVDKEVYLLLKRCKDLSALTQGAFDISTGALKALYNFTKEIFRMPDDSTLSHALQATGYRHMLLLDNNRVLLNRANMQIGFGAVGKGYAADKVKALLLSRGLRSGVVNASGDLTVWGRNADGHPWKVGIADPDNTGNILYWIPVENASVATSGNYEQYFEWKGTRYSHNIDPRTGLPVPYLKSVTVVSPSAELSDALATAVTVMGCEVGLDFINQLPGTHCIIIDHNHKIHSSENINLHAA